MRRPSMLLMGVVVWLAGLFAFFLLFLPWDLIPLVIGGVMIWDGLRRSRLWPVVPTFLGSVLLVVGGAWLAYFALVVYPTWPLAYCQSACISPARIFLQPIAWLASLIAATGIPLIAGGLSRHSELMRTRRRAADRMPSGFAGP